MAYDRKMYRWYVQLVNFKMKFVFVLLVTAIQCKLSIGQRPMSKFIR